MDIRAIAMGLTFVASMVFPQLPSLLTLDMDLVRQGQVEMPSISWRSCSVTLNCNVSFFISRHSHLLTLEYTYVDPA